MDQATQVDSKDQQAMIMKTVKRVSIRTSQVIVEATLNREMWEIKTKTGFQLVVTM